MARPRILSWVFLIMATIVLVSWSYTLGATTGKVRISLEGGPFMEVNGEKLAPLMLFINTDYPMEQVKKAYVNELQMARKAGIRFVSMITTLPWETDVYGERGFSHLSAWLDFIHSIYPEAYVIPRIRMEEPVNSAMWQSVYPNELIRYADGSTGQFSLASEVWRSQTLQALEALVKFVESNPTYAAQVVGYHLGAGESNEWFHAGYREKGNDVSTVNQEAYWKWLLRKYGSSDELAKAWGRERVTQEDAVIPVSYPRKAFLNPGEDQPYIDFNEYSSAIVADRLLEFAHKVKELTNGAKLVVVFYGYLFDLPDANSGHLALNRILESPDVDVLVSPYEYHDRGSGGSGAVMSVIDSAPLHGKLWIMEDDTRTHLSAPDTGFGRAATLGEAMAIHQRNLGSLITRGAGTWWMDLQPGWLDDAQLWDNIANMACFYANYRANRGAFMPDVAVVVDEGSYRYAANGRATNMLLLYQQRLLAYRAGVSIGFYLLDDVANGLVKGPKIYIFANAHHLTPAQRQGIDKLKRDGNVLVWVYGADFITDGEIGAVTGFQLAPVSDRRVRALIEVKPGIESSWNALVGRTLGDEVRGSPVFAVHPDDGVVALGTYVGGRGEIGLAVKRYKNWTSVFYGSWKLEPEIIRTLADQFGVPVYMRSNDIVSTDGTFFSIHATQNGCKRLLLPRNARVKDAFAGQILAEGVRSYDFYMQKGETRWLVVEYSGGCGHYATSNELDNRR